MAFPKGSEIDNVLLQVLDDLGGHAKPQDVYPRVAEFFPQLTSEDLEARLPSSDHTRKWWNAVQWAKQRLQDNECINGTPNSSEGEWAITQRGREVLQQNPPARPSAIAATRHSVVQETAQSAPVFSEGTFELLKLLHAQPTQAFYKEHKDEFKTHLEVPLAKLFQEVANRMPTDMARVLEMGSRILAKISKNDYGQGGAWDFLWGAFYPKGGKRIDDAQLYITVNHEGLKYGFSVADYGKTARKLFASNLKAISPVLAAKLSESLKPCGVVYGEHDNGFSIAQSGVSAGQTKSFEEWISNLSQYGPTAKTYVTKEQAVSMSGEELAGKIADLFERLFPLFLMARQEHPLSQPAAEKPAQNCQYWTFSPGEDAESWEEFQQQGIMAIGWDEMGDLRLFKSKDEMRLKLQELWPNNSDKKNDAHACWQFVYDIKAGDVVFAKQGSTQLLGYGVVESDYDFDATRPHYKHVRKVKWLGKGEWDMPGDSKMALKTLTDITPDGDFVKLIAKKVGLVGEPVEKPSTVKNPDYPLSQCAADSGFTEDVLRQWVRGISRKGQAIVYGAPGTGKTFIAEKLAKHLIGGGDGISDIVQFHPAYAYEDFIQGIRPQTVAGGGLAYPLVSGRFLDFCKKAESRHDTCVLIIDEINRANLARVFGELMYLLEYRKQKIALAGGTTFQIPENVRLIGTMNTADRSIALVDHALRRRFAFIPLSPQYGVIEKFHEKTGFAPTGLIQVLKSLNSIINDKHYHVGISFFLRPDLKNELGDIWELEIEPYLEEFFFDQPDKLEPFRWEKIKPKVLA